MRAAWSYAVAAVFVAGCTSVLGLDDKAFDGMGSGGATASASGSGGAAGAGHAGGPADGGTTASAGGSGGAGSCECIAGVPGWIGPVTLDPVCPAGWSGLSELEAVPFPAPSVQCSPCSCNGTGGCSAARLDYYSDATCTTGLATEGPGASCMTLSSAPRSAKLTLPCHPAGGVTTLPKDGQVVSEEMCTAPEVPGCAGVCVPTGERACIVMMGAQTSSVECPSAFATKLLIGGTLTDTRACSSCSCGSCIFEKPELTTACGDTSGFAAVDELCDVIPLGSGTTSTFETLLDDLPCNASGGVASGDVTPTANAPGIACCAPAK